MSICKECHSATLDYIPPDYPSLSPAHYKCRLCGNVVGDDYLIILEDEDE